MTSLGQWSFVEYLNLQASQREGRGSFRWPGRSYLSSTFSCVLEEGVECDREAHLSNFGRETTGVGKAACIFRNILVIMFGVLSTNHAPDEGVDTDQGKFGEKMITKVETRILVTRTERWLLSLVLLYESLRKKEVQLEVSKQNAAIHKPSSLVCIS